MGQHGSSSCGPLIFRAAFRVHPRGHKQATLFWKPAMESTPFYDLAPPGWPQRRRTGLSLPPTTDAGEFEIYRDVEPGGWGWQTYQINLRSLQIYAQNGKRWDAPGWAELPKRVRAHIWALHRQRAEGKQ